MKMARRSGDLVFDGCRIASSVEGRFRGSVKVVKGAVHADFTCGGCDAEVFHLNRTDFRSELVEKARMHIHGYTVTDREGNVLLEAPPRGLLGGIQSGDATSYPLSCSKCGTIGTFHLKWEMTDSSFNDMLRFRTEGRLHVSHGGIVDVNLEIKGATFDRHTSHPQCICNNMLVPEEFRQILENFCIEVEHYLREGSAIPKPVEFEEKIRCGRCINNVATLSGTLTAKIPKLPHELADSVRRWASRTPLFMTPRGEIETEPMY